MRQQVRYGQDTSGEAKIRNTKWYRNEREQVRYG